jgi:hypothetical protein
LVTELTDSNLLDYITNKYNTGIPLCEIMNIIHCVLEGLAFAHTQGNSPKRYKAREYSFQRFELFFYNAPGNSSENEKTGYPNPFKAKGTPNSFAPEIYKIFEKK